MTYLSCSVQERFVNPLFEVFDGGDFILSSYRDIEEDFTRMRIFLEKSEDAPAAELALRNALEIVGLGDTEIESAEMPDEDWKFAYRRHFKTEQVSPRIFTVPEWEWEEFKQSGRAKAGQIAIVSDPGMAFGTGKHETTKACLQFIDEVGTGGDFLDMGCGSGILSIAAAKLGFKKVAGFDVDQEAVDASIENAEKNGVSVEYRKFALGRGSDGKNEWELVAANILGPLLIRFADEIRSYCKGRLIISGILNELYPEVLAAYEKRGFKELSRKTLGEWTTGLLAL